MNYIFLFCFFLFNKKVCYSTDIALYAVRDDVHQFNQWRQKYNKIYDKTTDLSFVFSTWRMNKNFVTKHNKENKEYSVELNAFSDVHKLVWVHRKAYNQVLAKKKQYIPRLYNLFFPTPSSIDWREKGVVTPIKNQHQCGSCWAFSAVGSMEGQHAIKTGNLVSLSESQLVDCDSLDKGCDGGNINNAFKYVISQGGIDTEKDYPYSPNNSPCRFNKSSVAATFTGYTDVTGGEEGLKTALATIGPVSVGIDATSQEFQF